MLTPWTRGQPKLPFGTIALHQVVVREKVELLFR